MTHITKIQPAVEPVSLSEMRAHLGISNANDTVRDSVISARITAVRQIIEIDINRPIVSQSIVCNLHDFPWACYRRSKIDLLKKLQSVVEIRYLDVDGVQQVLAPSEYKVITEEHCVLPVYGKTWPLARDEPASVQIEYIAGYGNANLDVPQFIKEAIMFAVGTWETYQSSLEGIGTYPPDVPNVATNMSHKEKDYRGIPWDLF